MFNFIPAYSLRAIYLVPFGLEFDQQVSFSTLYSKL